MESRAKSQTSAAQRKAPETFVIADEAEERVRDLLEENQRLKARNRDIQHQYDALDAVAVRRDVESEENPAEQCQVALARLLECLSHDDRRSEPQASGEKRRGSWTSTLRGAAGRFLGLMRELTEEAAHRRVDRVESKPEMASGKPKTTRAAEKQATWRGVRRYTHREARAHENGGFLGSDDEMTPEQLDLLDKRIKKKFGMREIAEAAKPVERQSVAEIHYAGPSPVIDRLLETRMNPPVVVKPPPEKETSLALPRFW